MKFIQRFLISALTQTSWSKSLRFGLFVVVVSAILSLLIPDYYHSVISILPASDFNNGSNAPGGGLLSGAKAAMAATGVGLGIGADLGVGGSDQSMSYEDIVRSRSVNAPLLRKTYVYGRKWWHFGQEYPRTQTLLSYLWERNEDKGLSTFQNIVDVKKDLKTGLTTIEVSTTSPELSQQIARDLREGLERGSYYYSQDLGKAKVKCLERQITLAQKEQEESEKRLVTGAKVISIIRQVSIRKFT